MPSSWDPKSPALLPTIVCYADILGFRSMTERAFNSGTEGKFLVKIKRSLAAAYDKVREMATLDGEVSPIFDMKVFSDNIVVAHPLRDPDWDHGEPELGTFLMLFAQVQAGLAADGLFLRGAIAAGQHYQDDDIAYGKALLEAVDLDKSGGPPRLVIAPSVEALIAKHLPWYGGSSSPLCDELLEDPRDGSLFIDYLEAAFGHFPPGPVGHELLQAHRNKVSEGLSEHGFDTSVGKKYMWLAIYHNYACRTFAGRFRVGGDWDYDPEAGAAEAEAQRVLDYLVPLEDEPSEQLPRPFDAERLQQSLAENQT